MQLSKGFDYAVRSMVHLAMLPKGTAAELKAIAEAQQIPVSYLAKVMRNLVRGGLVTSTLGRGGGYTLRKQPSDITLLQIYGTIEGEMRLMECMDNDKNCFFFEGCGQARVWRRLRETVESIFSETTLLDLLPAPMRNKMAKPIKERKYARAGA
jgi:Rrf2 family iron-sulfur cluster assembly transcriptional regulator